MTESVFFNWPTPVNVKWSSSRLCLLIFKSWSLDCTWKPSAEFQFSESVGYPWIESLAERPSGRLISSEGLSGFCSHYRLSLCLARSYIRSPRVRFSTGDGDPAEMASPLISLRAAACG